MDYYVCTRGDRDYRLTESLKYWRFRLVAIPLNQVTVKINKKIMETASTDEPCDIYDVVLDTGAGTPTSSHLMRISLVRIRLVRNSIRVLPVYEVNF